MAGGRLLAVCIMYMYQRKVEIVKMGAFAYIGRSYFQTTPLYEIMSMVRRA